MRRLREADVFSPRTLGALTGVESDRLTLAKLVELTVGARRLVEEVLVAIRGGYESKTLFTHQSLDRSIHCHVVSGSAPRLRVDRQLAGTAEMIRPGVRARFSLRQWGQSYSLYVS
jgi:hypothetical protein